MCSSGVCGCASGETGGKRHEMPCHHTLEAYLHAYLEQTGLRNQPKSPLCRTSGWISAGASKQ